MLDTYQYLYLRPNNLDKACLLYYIYSEERRNSGGKPMDYKKMDTITNKLSYIAAFISSITSIVSIALVLTGKIEEWMKTPFYQVVFLMLSVALVFCTFYFIKNIKKYKTIRGQLEAQNNILTEDVNLLRENICFGLEYLANDVNIEFIKGKKNYEHISKMTENPTLNIKFSFFILKEKFFNIRKRIKSCFFY